MQYKVFCRNRLCMGGCNPLVLICSVYPALNSNNQSYLYSLEGKKEQKIQIKTVITWTIFMVYVFVEMTKLNLLILAATNSKYVKRLLTELRVQYMKTTSSEHVYTNLFFFVFVLTFRTIYVHNML